MASLTCNCGFSGQAPASYAGRSVRCSRCRAVILVPLEPTPFDFKPITAVRRKKRKPVALVVSLLMAAALAWYFWPTARVKEMTDKVIATVSSPSAIAIRHIKENMGEPGSFELVKEWPSETLTIRDKEGLDACLDEDLYNSEVTKLSGTYTAVQMKFRAKNGLGVMRIFERVCLVQDDTVISLPLNAYELVKEMNIPTTTKRK